MGQVVFRAYILAYIACFGLWWPSRGPFGRLKRVRRVLCAACLPPPVALRATDARALINTHSSSVSVAATLLVRAAAVTAGFTCGSRCGIMDLLAVYYRKQHQLRRSTR